MNAPRHGKPGEVADLRARLTEAEETLRAIRSGEVDTLVVEGRHGPQVFTLQGAEHAYRVLIESMNEGALTLTDSKMILYANQCFARMVKCPLEKVIGGSFRRFLSEEDRASLKLLMKRSTKSGAKIRVTLNAVDGTSLPAQFSIHRLEKNGLRRANISMVVTDMTEATRTEKLMRALTHRVVQVQEAERGRVAFELHDNITQLLCAVLFRSQALANKLSARDGTSKREAIKIRDMLGKTADEVVRISHNMGPTVLDHLGLTTVLRDAGSEFEGRTGVSVKLACVEMATRLHPDTELALFRILQEALRNIEKHAAARHVSVRLSQKDNNVRLSVSDDGVGFGPTSRKGLGGLGLLSMTERATYVGGTLKITSAKLLGTEVVVLIPIPPV